MTVGSLLAVIASVAVAAIVTVVLQPAPARPVPVPLPRSRPVVDEVTRFGPVSEVPDWFKRVMTEPTVYAAAPPVYAAAPPVYAAAPLKQATDPVCGARGRTHYRRDGWQSWRCNRP
jgi:hypothetical protein